MAQMNNANKVIITTSNSENDTLTYQCDFNFTSPIRDFLNKYNSFKIIHKTNTTNEYIIKPLVFIEGFKLNLSSIQTNNQTTPVLTANNRVYYEYNDATKFVTINSTFNKNDLGNTYYDRTTKKFYLGDPKNNNTELIFNNNNIISGYYIPDFSSELINTEAYESELNNAFYDPTQDKFFVRNNIELTTFNDTIVYLVDKGMSCKIKYFNS
jgi:hypothetical protein